MATIGKTNAVAAMRARIQEHVNLEIIAARHDDGILAHISREKRTLAAQLTLMRYKQPAARENLRKLALVNIRVPENAPVNRTALGINKI
jgi:hypothetical protein